MVMIYSFFGTVLVFLSGHINALPLHVSAEDRKSVICNYITKHKTVSKDVGDSK